MFLQNCCRKEPWTSSHCVLQDFTQSLEGISSHTCCSLWNSTPRVRHDRSTPTWLWGWHQFPSNTCHAFQVQENQAHCDRGQTDQSKLVALCLLQTGTTLNSGTSAQLGGGFSPELGRCSAVETHLSGGLGTCAGNRLHYFTFLWEKKYIIR